MKKVNSVTGELSREQLDTFNNVFTELLGDKPVKRFGVAGLPLMTIGVYEALAEALKVYGDVKIEKADDIVNIIRMIKTENELKCMRAAADITHKTFDYVLENIKVDMD